MEKSIETIWEDGFLDTNTLVVPKLKNLYNQKSTHIIDKIMRMGRINLIYLVILALGFLIGGIVLGAPYLGVFLCLLIAAHLILALKHTKQLKEIDKNINSYEYLKSFDDWLTYFISDFMILSRFFYPLFFLSFVVQGRFTEEGEAVLNYIIANNSETSLIFGIPIFIIVIVLVIAGLLAICGGWLYKLDLNIAYGRVLKKMKEIIADMEELRH